MTRHRSTFQESSALQLSCEHTFGITSTSNAAFCSHPASGLLAYAAGCVIVIVDVRKSIQTTRIINNVKKEIISLTFSNDGKFIASGESGHKPAARVWEVSSGQLFSHFEGHDNAIPFVNFSPDDKFLVSIGNHFDNTINLWNWRKKERVGSTKNTAEIHAVTFPTGESNHFLTVGKGHAKFWFIEEDKNGQFSLKSVSPLGSLVRKIFTSASFTENDCSVAATGNRLMKFSVEPSTNHKDRWLSKVVAKNELKQVKRINTLAVDHNRNLTYIGCENGTIRVLNEEHGDVGSLPKPHRVDALLGGDSKPVENVDETISIHPDTIALSLIGSDLLAAVYSDHSVYVWNVANLKSVSKLSSWCYHSCRVLNLEVYPAVKDDTRMLPAGSFATCSNDGTIRIWQSETFEMIQVIYCADMIELHNTKVEPSPSCVPTCLKFNANGKEIAVGFRDGSIRAYDLANLPSFKVIKPAEPNLVGHNASVSAMEYSANLLASASGTEGFINIFNVDKNYALHQHLKSLQSSTVNSIRFVKSKFEPSQLWLISSAQDKSIRLHSAKLEPDNIVGKFDDGRQIVLPCSPHEIEVNEAQGVAIVSCHDRMVRMYELFQNNNSNNEPVVSFSGAGSNDGTLKHHSVDSSGSLLATISSDKTISLACRPWDVRRNRTVFDRIVAIASGHSEQMTGVKFLASMRKFVTTSNDSCAFLWNSPPSDVIDKKVVTLIRQSSANSDSPKRASSRDSKNSSPSEIAKSTPTSPLMESKPLFDDQKRPQKRKQGDQNSKKPEKVIEEPEKMAKKTSGESDKDKVAKGTEEKPSKKGTKASHGKDEVTTNSEKLSKVEISPDKETHQTPKVDHPHKKEIHQKPKVDHPLKRETHQKPKVDHSVKKETHQKPKVDHSPDEETRQTPKVDHSPKKETQDESKVDHSPDEETHQTPKVGHPPKKETPSPNVTTGLEETNKLTEKVAESPKLEDSPENIKETAKPPVEEPVQVEAAEITMSASPATLEVSMAPAEETQNPLSSLKIEVPKEDLQSTDLSNSDVLKIQQAQTKTVYTPAIWDDSDSDLEIDMEPLAADIDLTPIEEIVKPPRQKAVSESSTRSHPLSYAAVVSQSTQVQKENETHENVVYDDASKVQSFANLSLQSAAPKPASKPKTLEIISTSEIKQPTTTPEEIDMMTTELQDLSQRLVNELHASPMSNTPDCMRRRIIQAIFQVRRELDDCLESAIFNEDA